MNLLKEVLSLQAESLETFAQQMLGYQALSLLNIPVKTWEDRYGNIYVQKGKAPFNCVVAHLDQVHDYDKDFEVLEHKGVLFGWNGVQQVGVGGDDKCGVYLALRALQTYPNVKVCFFLDEEVGMLGSNKADLTFFEDCQFIVQPDRNHYTDDFITYTNGVKTASVEFEQAALPYLGDYQIARGSCTDIGELVLNGLDISCVNIACGYYFAHTDQEIVVKKKVIQAEKLMFTLFSHLSYKQWKLPAKVRDTWDECDCGGNLHLDSQYVWCDLCNEYEFVGDSPTPFVDYKLRKRS